MFRYRAWNINGAGEFSETAYLVAAQVPSRPPKPTYSSSTDTSVSIDIHPSSDDGGKIITSIILQVADY